MCSRRTSRWPEKRTRKGWAAPGMRRSRRTRRLESERVGSLASGRHARQTALGCEAFDGVVSIRSKASSRIRRLGRAKCQRHVDRAAFVTLVYRQAAFRENVHHRLVLAQDIGFEGAEAARACDSSEVPQQATGDAQAVIILLDDEGDLGGSRAL